MLAFPAVAVSTASTALLYGVAGAMGARQVVRTWRGVDWQANLAAALVAVPVLATVMGSGPGIAVLVIALLGALLAGSQEPLQGVTGGGGRLAAAGVLVQSVGPLAVAGGAMVLLRDESAVVACMLLLMVCAYEAGDFVIGSGGSTPIEGPLAGMLAFILVGFPGALVWVEPFDVMDVWVLIVAALTCVVGQWIASAVLPKPGAKAPALRRLDTLLVLAPFWVAATAAL